jgi:hypothetical protein
MRDWSGGRVSEHPASVSQPGDTFSYPILETNPVDILAKPSDASRRRKQPGPQKEDSNLMDLVRMAKTSQTVNLRVFDATNQSGRRLEDSDFP